MKRRITLSLVALFAAMLFSAITASAQPLIWNPPCRTLHIKDMTGLGFQINVVTSPSGLVGPAPVPVLPSGAAGPFLMPWGATVNGIISLGGFFYPVIQPGLASPPAPIPSNGWIPNVTLAPGICVDIYLDLTNCNIYVYPTRFLPPCRP